MMPTLMRRRGRRNQACSHGYRAAAGRARRADRRRTGSMRPVWAPLHRRISPRSAPEDDRARFARGDQYLRDAGVFYRSYGASSRAERALAAQPRAAPDLTEAEWAADRRRPGPARRPARNGGGRHLRREPPGRRRRICPPRSIAENPEWLRPMVRHQAAPRAFPAFHRLRDRPRAGWAAGGCWATARRRPSGAGFALENRVATSARLPRSLRPSATSTGWPASSAPSAMR